MRRLSEIALEEPCYQWYKRGAVRKLVGRAPRCDDVDHIKIVFKVRKLVGRAPRCDIPIIMGVRFVWSGSLWGARLVVT